MQLEIMDTTLRDGEQTPEVSFSVTEKLTIAKLLLTSVKVDRIEVASARVSKGEHQAVTKIMDWAKQNNFLDKVEVLGFVDGGQSIDWIQSAGGKYLNLLAKGSLKHVTLQLKKTPDTHITEIKQTIKLAKSKGLTVNLYLEDWSNGMSQSPEYLLHLLKNLQQEPIARFMLPDTLGVLNYETTYQYCKQMTTQFPELKFDFHAHNDYGLAVANSMAAVKAGIYGLHATVNGLGERTGNAALSTLIPALHDHQDIKTMIDETKLNEVSQIVEAFSGIRVPKNMPIIGENVYTQTCGVHADGDQKGDLYCNQLQPKRFNRIRKYALGKTSGKASIRKNLEALGIELDEQALKAVTAKVVELGDKKQSITPYDLPYIIADVEGHGHPVQKIEISSYQIQHIKGHLPSATITLRRHGSSYLQTATGDGQFDAFMNALKIINQSLNITLPELIDYRVSIPPGGRTDALVDTTITWKHHSETFSTKGLDSDQTVAAIKATVKMLNICDRET